MAYVDLWLTDAAEEHDPQRAAAWLDWFDAHKVEGVGFGLVTARRAEHFDPVVRVESLRQQLSHPFGDEVNRWFERQDWLRMRPGPESLLAERYLVAPGLTLHQEAEIGVSGWDVTRQVLVQTEGLRWSEEIDPVLLAARRRLRRLGRVARPGGRARRGVRCPGRRVRGDGRRDRAGPDRARIHRARRAIPADNNPTAPDAS